MKKGEEVKELKLLPGNLEKVKYNFIILSLILKTYLKSQYIQINTIFCIKYIYKNIRENVTT